MALRDEYARFLSALDDAGTPANTRKIANLVLDHLDEIAQLTTSHGRRVRHTSELAQKHWNSLSDQIQPSQARNQNTQHTISRLTRLSVGPFRGFARSESFDLAGKYVLIYGQNGTGKSSFCEALEYSLLGSVAEAADGRFRAPQEYLRNARQNQFSPPSLIGIDLTGREIELQANESLFRFCFVEKNRIDGFARIAAKAPSKQKELISTLFGLEDFEEFVRNFTQEMDHRYIDLFGEKSIALNQKRQELDGAKQQLTSAQQQLADIARQEAQLSNEYRPQVTYEQMLLELNGNGSATGSIETLEKTLQEPLQPKFNLTKQNLAHLWSQIQTTTSNLQAKKVQLQSFGQELSYKQLYEGISRLVGNNIDHCPACLTPLDHVVENPFIRANEQLQQLEHLATLESDITTLEQKLQPLLLELAQVIKVCTTQFPQNNALSILVVNTGCIPDAGWWNSLAYALSDGYTPYQHLETQIALLEQADISVSQQEAIRNQNKEKLQTLKEFARRALVLNIQKDGIQKTIAANQKLISEFNTKNSQLITEVEAEKSVLARNGEIANSYRDFVKRLNFYHRGLPQQLVEDLGEDVVTLYNSFNRNDAPNELLSAVKLPLEQNQRLEFSYRDDPEKFYDALHVLSEGHIRCLGLAILLAKNIKESCPILIFDDPVNAIDDDHRESIRRTIFEDDFFKDTQIVLTCHGEEFFKDIQNLLPSTSVASAKLFVFMPRLDEPHVRVDHNCAPRNYILSAREHLNRSEIRESLAKSRQALESLTQEKIWRYVGRFGDNNLSIKLTSASSPIQLRNLTEQLAAKINKGDFSDANKTAVSSPMQSLLGISGNSREWRYLNKGTHDETDRGEFDILTVKEIVDYLEQLDLAISS